MTQGSWALSTVIFKSKSAKANGKKEEKNTLVSNTLEDTIEYVVVSNDSPTFAVEAEMGPE